MDVEAKENNFVDLICGIHSIDLEVNVSEYFLSLKQKDLRRLRVSANNWKKERHKTVSINITCES